MGDEPTAIEEALARAALLPGPAVAALFARYGRPLDEPPLPRAPASRASRWRRPTASSPPCAPSTCARWSTLIGNDWFVLEAPGEPTLAMPGPLFASAVAALTRRARGDES